MTIRLRRAWAIIACALALELVAISMGRSYVAPLKRAIYNAVDHYVFGDQLAEARRLGRLPPRKF